MRILLVTGIFPPDIGGPATYVPEIAKALLERGHQVSVVTTSEPEGLDLDDNEHPFPVYRMNRRIHLGWRSFYFSKTILHHAKKADVVLANGVFLEATVASFWRENRWFKRLLAIRPGSGPEIGGGPQTTLKPFKTGTTD